MKNGPETSRDEVSDEAVAAARTEQAVAGRTASVESRNTLDWHRAETDRLRVLVDFLARPIHAPGGSEPDPDVFAAYNLAVEAALNSVRWASRMTDTRRPS